MDKIVDGQNGTDKIVWTKWYGTNGIDEIINQFANSGPTDDVIFSSIHFHFNHGRRPGAEFGGTEKSFRRPNFRMTFFREKFLFNAEHFCRFGVRIVLLYLPSFHNKRLKQIVRA